MDLALIPDHYLKAVLSIGIRKQDGTIGWFGTGFMIIKKVGEKQYRPFLVTNKHVLFGKQSVVIRLQKKDSDQLVTIDVSVAKNGEKLYSVHPDDKVDIAVMTLVGSYFDQNNLKLAAFEIDNAALDSSQYVNEGGSEGSGVYMLGFPMGLVEVDSNMPICRSGCVARITQSEIERTKNFLLDIQNFPGNSGSPVISKPELVSVGDTKALGKSVLIGIIHSYIPYRETLINSQTKETVEIRSENSGLASANPVEYIRETMDIEMQRVVTNISQT